MTPQRVFIAGAGVVSPVGSGAASTAAALAAGTAGLRPLTLFGTPTPPLPVGEVVCDPGEPDLPRTHRLARFAADQAMAGSSLAPDLVVVGTTTAGMHTTERLLQAGVQDPQAYRRHAAGSVAEDLAERYGCTGPVLTVSTACSSGAVAVALALEMLRAGHARRALVGGADSLCKLTYYGFNSLQLIDPAGARPMDRERRGMSVAEGAAMLLLRAGDEPGPGEIEVLGAGLSCDAYHPAAPHPDGAGAQAAMEAALADAGLKAAAVDYINLHGTGTPDNDRAEARAVARVFGNGVPVSSIKGATGHSLAAAGAIEAVVAAICVRDGLVPGNTNLRTPDPELPLTPVGAPRRAPVRTVLSNSFGFGGNNAALVIGAPRAGERGARAAAPRPLRVLAAACITGAGHTDETLARLRAGQACAGVLPLDEVSRDLPARAVRRLKAMPRLAMALGEAVRGRSGLAGPPGSVFFGTGWGALAETHGFLTSLFESGDRFPSPTEFVGSVHNAPAGQVAILCGATGPNVTMTGEDDAFEQALLAAAWLGRRGDGPALVLGADEHHPLLSGLFDASVAHAGAPAAGGAALLLDPAATAPGVTVFPSVVARSDAPGATAELIERLGGPQRIRDRFGALLVGIPAGHRERGEAQLAEFQDRVGPGLPIVDTRRWVGEFASASAVAVCLAVTFATEGAIPAPLTDRPVPVFRGRGCLVLGLGRTLTAVEVLP